MYFKRMCEHAGSMYQEIGQVVNKSQTKLGMQLKENGTQYAVNSGDFLISVPFNWTPRIYPQGLDL